VHALYAIGSYLAVLLLLPVLLFHPKLRHGIKERLGFYRSRETPGEGAPPSGSTGPAPATCSRSSP
jgi:3-deoxy-D-manno-octulosonic-acid transferase